VDLALITPVAVVVQSATAGIRATEMLLVHGTQVMAAPVLAVVLVEQGTVGMMQHFLVKVDMAHSIHRTICMELILQILLRQQAAKDILEPVEVNPAVAVATQEGLQVMGVAAAAIRARPVVQEFLLQVEAAAEVAPPEGKMVDREEVD
jgi:hypothetical protein